MYSKKCYFQHLSMAQKKPDTNKSDKEIQCRNTTTLIFLEAPLTIWFWQGQFIFFPAASTELCFAFESENNVDNTLILLGTAYSKSRTSLVSHALPVSTEQEASRMSQTGQSDVPSHRASSSLLSTRVTISISIIIAFCFVVIIKLVQFHHLRGCIFPGLHTAVGASKQLCSSSSWG